MSQEITKIWRPRGNAEQQDVEALKSALSVGELLAKVLLNRGIRSYEQAALYFNPPQLQLHDPFLFNTMPQAVDLIMSTLEMGDPIMVYGDYDVDGTTAVSMLMDYFNRIGANAIYHIPDRYEEGYGVSLQGIELAIQKGCQLLITVDCGIRDFKAIEMARSNGIEVIVCDHHEPADTLPNARVVLNPKCKDSGYPFPYLSGCGVGYKLVQALDQSLPQPVGTSQYLDLVAIATTCDIVPLIGENRRLVFEGLAQLNDDPRPGFYQLVERAGRSFPLTAEDVSFTIGPRINAAGRMDHGKWVVELLVGQDPEQAKDIVELIENYNTDRRSVEQATTQEALVQLNKSRGEHSSVVYASHWHKGVIGIVASRLLDQFHKPTIVFTESNGKITGSGRSTDQFDLCNGLAQCEDLIEKFGGHHHAAGLTILPQQLDSFKHRFDEVVGKQLTAADQTPILMIDGELEFSQINAKLYRTIQRMEPFGPLNPKPVFVARHITDSGESRLVGEDKSHLKCTFYQHGIKMQGIGFKLGHHAQYVQSGAPFEIAFTLSENRWRGKSTIQLQVVDIHY